MYTRVTSPIIAKLEDVISRILIPRVFENIWRYVLNCFYFSKNLEFIVAARGARSTSLNQISKISHHNFQVHGKDAVLSYDSDDDSLSEATSPPQNNGLASPASTNQASEPINNNNNSSQMPPQQPPAAAQPNHHHSSLTTSGLTGLSSHFNHNGGQYHHYHNQMTSHDFKPQYLADWYSHGVTSIGGMSRYDPASVASKPTHHVSAALPTPPSTGHSPIQSLSSQLHLLPSTTAAYT